MNKQAAIEWLEKAWHHFSSGRFLYEADHYSDVIAIDLHYAIEIMLKAMIAYENRKMIKTHNLIEIHSHIIEKIAFDEEELELLDIVSTYHTKASYPPFDRKMPSKGELKRVIEFADRLYSRVCTILEIDEEDVKR